LLIFLTFTTLDLLQEAALRFDNTSPFSIKSRKSRLSKLIIRLVRITTEAISDSNAEDSQTEVENTRSIVNVAATITLTIEDSDSILSLEDKLRKILNSLRYPKSLEPSQAVDGSDASEPVVIDWYPTNIPLYDQCLEYFGLWHDTRGLQRVSIAKDALLRFFDFDIDTMSIDYSLNS
jgi:hypothetical protein